MRTFVLSRLACAAILVITSQLSHAQYSIRTFAGGGPPDGIQATSTTVIPVRVAADGAGNLYVSDNYQNRIFKIRPNGMMSTAAGNGGLDHRGDGGPARDASINRPYGVAIDSQGNLYFTESDYIRKVTPAGMISTFAGNGDQTFSGDGGPAARASLYMPRGVAVDNAGNVYIADTGHRRIRKVMPSGLITTIAGTGAIGFAGDGGPAVDALMDSPTDVAADSAGNVYFIDATRRVRKIGTSGIVTTVAGNGTYGSGAEGEIAIQSKLSPAAIAISPAGELYIAVVAGRVWRLSNGVLTAVAGNGVVKVAGDNGPATSASLRFPKGIAFDAAGALYIADSDSDAIPTNSVVRKVSPDGIITTVVGGSGSYGEGRPASHAQLTWPNCVATDASGNVFLCDNTRVKRVSAAFGTISTVAGNDSALHSGDGGLATNAGVLPRSVAVDGQGNLYIATYDSRVRKVTSSGIISTIAGTGVFGYLGDGGPATAAKLGDPMQIALDRGGSIYIADRSNSRIRRVTPDGQMETFAGSGAYGFSGDGGPATSARLELPEGVTVDNAGNVYIADTGNSRVRKVSPSGIITTVAGNGVAGFAGDSGPATSAQMSPRQVAVDAAGNLFITDGRRIRKVGANGIIVTVAGGDYPGYAGDGGPAASSMLSGANSLAVDPAGTLYIGDTDNLRVRYFGPPIVVQPAYLRFTYDRGGALPAPQPLTLSYSEPTQIAASVSSGAEWLSVSPGTTNTPATFTVSVAPDALIAADYSGSIRLTSTNLLVNVPVYLTVSGSCAASASPSTSYAAPPAGTTASFNVTSTPGCPWVANSDVAWITILAGGTGTNNGTVSFRVAPNSGPPRRGTISLTGNQTFLISQEAPVGGSPGLRFVPILPCRAVDTRSSLGAFGYPMMQAGTPRSFALPLSSCGIPATAAAYSLNVTVQPPRPRTLGYLTLWPTGSPQPLVSTLNSFDGRIKANAAIVPAGTNGAVSVFVTDYTDVVLDVNGYFVPPDAGGNAFYPLAPCRVSDTRLADGPLGGPFMRGGESRTIAVVSSNCKVPSNADAYSLNFTAVPKGELSYLSTWPAGSPTLYVSTLNAFTGTVTANAAIVPAGTNGSIVVYTYNATDVVLDINGHYSAPGSPGGLSFYPVTPCRVSDTRLATGLFGGPGMAAGETRAYPVAASACGIPSTARAYSLNVTVVPQGSLSYLTLWPAGEAQPFVSTLNAMDGSVTSNAAIVPASAGGSINVFVTNPTHVILDINGYFK
ncbi:MAG: hypothetical protein HY820_36385 [Acidobacteria bacterium]|nr:hypothetical protein [Acidobacteriota bacterium]